MARCSPAAAARRRRRRSSSSADEASASSRPPPSSPSRPPRRVAHPVLATMALLMLSSSSSSVARAAVTATAPGSPTMGCWRHPQERPGEKGTLARCEGFVDVGPRQGKLFTFTIPPKDVDNRAYDIEVVLETEGGDLDLYVYPPSGSSLQPFASSRAVGRDTAYISRSSLFPGRYDFLVAGGPEGRGKGKATVEFVTPRRRMLNGTAAALKGFLSTCCDASISGGTKDGDDAASRPCSRLLEQAAPLADAPPLEVPDYCSMAGVICARNGSLLELNLPRSGLSCDLSDPRALPALAAAAPALASLDLSGNDLTRTRIELVAPALGSLGFLELLDLSASGLRGDLGRACALVFPPENSSSPPSPSSRSRLRSVNLAANEVGGALPSCLVSETPSLQALHLDFNPLVGALPPKFGEGLVLFTAAAPAAIGDDDDASSSRGSSRVGGGGARSGGITGSLPASLPHKMAHLDLSNNRVEGALPASLPESTTQLHLGGNALSGELPAALFSSPSRLRSLRLGSNAFTGPLPDSWAASSALRVLELSGNALSGELPSNWSGAEYLSVLSLADNELEGSLPATLAASRALVVLDVSGNRLSGGLADFANALPVRGERGEDDRGSLLKSFSIARNPGLNEGTLAAAAALSRLGAFAPPSLEPAVKVPGREEAVASASAAFARRRAVGLRGGGGGGAGSSSSSSGSSAGDDGETLVPPALPGIQEPSDAEMIAAASPRVFDAAGCAGLGGPFPAWLVTATAAASSAVAAAARDVLNNARPAVDVRLAGVPLSCPPEGALFSVREQPPRRAFEGLACETMPGKGSSSSGSSVPISSLLRITREKDAAAKAKVAPTAAMSPDAVELSKARARATAVRVIGVVVSLATVATALALCARSCCGSSHRSRSKASSASSGLGSRFSRWRSNSDGEGGPSGAISSSSADPSASTAAAALRTRPIHKSASASAVVVSACAASPIAGASASLFVGSSSEDKL